MALQCTLHFACLLNTNGAANYVPLKAEKLKQFRFKFKDIAYVKISMLSGRNFDFVNKRLCEIKDTTSDPTVLSELLNRLRTGQPTDADIDTLRERATVDSSQPPFDTALRIFPTRKQVKEYNNQCFTVASQTASPDVYSIAAIDTDIWPSILDS